jgi:hypothetical protein
MVFVDPAQASNFEAHTQQVDMDQECPERAGVKGLGIGKVIPFLLSKTAGPTT